MHTILFGGSFDPPHNGHLQIAQHIIEQHIADELIYIPCKDHPFDKQMSSSTDRITMLQMLQSPHTSISLYEIEKSGKSYSYETLLHFSKTFPQTTFSWLIGADQVSVFDKWYKYEHLLKKFHFYVYPRTGYALDKLTNGMELLASMPPINISSTEIRAHVQQHTSILSLVPLHVERYIVEHRLYNLG